MEDIQKTAMAPEATAIAPEATSVAPEATAVAPLDLELLAPPTLSPPPKDRVISTGAEAEIRLIEKDGRKYALKLYKPGFRPNFKVQPALQRLQGKGLVADIYDSGVQDGRNFELMQYFPLGSAARFDLRGNAQAILAIVLRIAASLDACHKAGIVHKDVKPANILIKDKSTWDCVLCDFGIADKLDNGKSVTTQARTPIYAAPEIYDPSKARARIDGRDLFEIGPAADFYSLGMTVLCLWSGEAAFKSEEERMAVAKLSTGIKVPSGMPEPLASVTGGLLHKDPSRRWRLKDVEECVGGGKYGHFAVQHILNPLCDIALNCDPSSPGYAMTGETLGCFLNKVYLWHYADGKAPADIKLCAAVMDSFRQFDGSYMQAFFKSKAGRFENQEAWMRYCCDWDSEDNQGKAGPEDDETRQEISIMKTIAGFGWKPEYRFSSNGETVRTIEELEQSDADKKRALSEGLRGWLAVQYHENPDADLGEYGNYEDLLEDYVLELGECDPENDEYQYYCYACGKAEEVYDDISSTVRKYKTRTVVQTVAGVLLAVLPLLLVIFHTVSFLMSTPVLDVAEMKFGNGFYVLAVVAAAALYFLFDSDGCLLPIIGGGVAAGIVWVLLKFLRPYAVWVFLASAVALLVLFVVKVLFFRNPVSFGQLEEPGFEEYTVEPLYYAFSDEQDFDSSLNGLLPESDREACDAHLKSRRKRNVVFIAMALAMLAVATFIPGKQIIATDDTVQEMQVGQSS